MTDIIIQPLTGKKFVFKDIKFWSDKHNLVTICKKDRSMISFPRGIIKFFEVIPNNF